MNPVAVLLAAERSTTLVALLAPYGLRPEWGADGATPEGSFWGADEAGLVGDRLLLNPRTPLQSALHEAAHYVCMSPARRAGLHTDAGGSYDEEDAVCALQVLLADQLPGVGAARMLADMDAWGYSFRLGSAHRWWATDGEDARAWLRREGLIDEQGRPSGALRSSGDAREDRDAA